jgi:hypothetical protein
VVTGVNCSAPPSIQRKYQYSTNVLDLLIPVCPISQSTRTNQINAFRIPSVFACSPIGVLFRPLILLELLEPMSPATDTPSPLLSIVGYEAGNEEQSPPTGGVYNTWPMIIAFDGEGGIPYVERLMAQGGPTRPPGEGESQSSVSLPPSTDIHISFP